MDFFFFLKKLRKLFQKIGFLFRSELIKVTTHLKGN